MPDQTSEPPPKHAPPDIPARLWCVAAIIGAGAFLAMMDSTVINLAVGDIDTTFGLAMDGECGADLSCNWSPGILAVSCYLLAMAISLPLTGWLGNCFGNVRLWRATLITFLIGSLVCAIAPNAFFLIAGRIAQGLSAGMMIPVGQVLLRRMTGPDQLGRIMGSVGFAVALGPALGPAFGGWLIETFSWRWVFWLNIPVGGIALMGAGFLSNGQVGAKQDRRFDGWGYCVLAGGLLSVLGGAILAEQRKFVALGLVMIAAGSLMLVRFFRKTGTHQCNLIDPAVLGNAWFRAGFVASGMTAMNMYGGLLFLPIFLGNMSGFGLEEVGGLLFFLGIGAALALPVCGMLCDRLGAGRVLVWGALLLSIDTAALMVLGDSGFGMLAGLLMLRGAGLALAQMPAVTGAYIAVDKADMGDAATLINLIQRVGGCVGVAVIAMIIAWVTGPVSMAGLTFLLLLSVATITPAVGMMRADRFV
ncbi:MFS transporter [Thalassospira xiamenensis]|uniref:Drug resistance transporter, EmrB/QacA subfamily n=1 Tax=Thalassospira xiamenensis TaxID=220697 RepID=A0A285TFH6_9PROT|nr:MFS transporter [Thalassospira xiamenensis]SOC20812.1 drug resistance transporter, EmrB/QacA subfamily [Thalassospira xiamenensis]